MCVEFFGRSEICLIGLCGEKYNQAGMQRVHHLIAAVLGVALACVAFLSLKTLGPRWENDPTPGPLLLALLLAGAYWLAVLLLRSKTALPDSAKYGMLAAVCVTWALIYVFVKGHDDPPIIALFGPFLWMPALLIYRMPGAPKQS